MQIRSRLTVGGTEMVRPTGLCNVDFQHQGMLEGLKRGSVKRGSFGCDREDAGVSCLHGAGTDCREDSTHLE